MTHKPSSRTILAIALIAVGLLGLLLSTLFAERLVAPGYAPPTPADIRATIIARATESGSSTVPAALAATPGPSSIAPTAVPTAAPSLTSVPASPTLSPTVALTATPGATLTVSASATPPTVETAVVTAVLSGDTIEVFLNGQSVTVRYLGIDAPEVDERCGMEAANANAALVLPLEVRLVPDRTDSDATGRLLRYVYVGTTLVNAALVEGGWARPAPAAPDTALAAELAALATPGAARGCAALP